MFTPPQKEPSSNTESLPLLAPNNTVPATSSEKAEDLPTSQSPISCQSPKEQSPNCPLLTPRSTGSPVPDKESLKTQALAKNLNKSTLHGPTGSATKSSAQTRPLPSSPENPQNEPSPKRGKIDPPTNNKTPATQTPGSFPLSAKPGRKNKNCKKCSQSFRSLECLNEHFSIFHGKKSKSSKYHSPTRFNYKILKEHTCSDLPHKPCRRLYEV